MATLTKTLATFGLVVCTFSTSASADTYQHIDQLALDIARQSKLIVSESRHYQHATEYRHLVTDAADMYRLADHMHELAHHRGSVTHLESDLRKLDAEFHHLEAIVDRIERRAAHGYGHVHGHTSHVKQLLNSVEENIHHLQADLRSLRGPTHTVRPVVVQRPPMVTPPSRFNNWGGYNSSSYGNNSGHSGQGYGASAYGHRSNGRGITIGGGSSRFTIRF